MNQVSLQIGATLRGETYRIDKTLGQGGFGITYLATDLSLDRPVAIKEFFPKAFCDRDTTTSHVTLGTQSTRELVEKLKAKFLKEAKNIAKFNHPNIIKIHAAFEENNTAYYVMDFIEGESLSERLKRSGTLPPDVAVDYIRQIGAALDYVHSFHMNHLDVKPANIMVRKADDCPILIDFGLSKQYDKSGKQTSTTPVGISHGFAPMEQYIDGGIREFSPTTDEYSLAATLYYLLSGVTPPQAPELSEKELVFPVSVPTHLIPPLSKAMSQARKMRYPTVLEFVAAINGATPTADSTILVRPKPKEKKDIVAPKPKPFRKSLVVVWLVVIVSVPLVVWKPWRSAESDNIDIDTRDIAETDSVEQDSEEHVWVVISMSFHHSFGDCSYSGSVDNNNLPHGKGVATWTSGTAKEYDGEWNHGVMEGNATYTLRNGDVFEGTFHADKYNEGSYTSKSTGGKFVGTFKNGSPDKGTWYDKNGNLEEEL